jgi:hypothetical protein
MRRRRLIIFPAMLAALVLAPSSAFASGPVQPVSSDVVVAADPSPTLSLPDVQPPDASVAPGPGDASTAPAPVAPEEPSAAPSQAAPLAPTHSPTPRSQQPETRPGREDAEEGRRGHAAPVGDPSRKPRRARGSASPEGTAPVQTPVAPGTGAANGLLPDGDPLPTVLIVGMGAVAAVALVGTLWLVLANRRERASADPGTPAIPAMDQRTLRRARMRASQDPILASMGLDADPAEEATRDSPKPAAKRNPRPPRR